MFLSDYHTHTNYSFDSSVSVKDRILWAINNNITELCLTDHLDYNESDCYIVPDFKKYKLELAQLQELYADKIKIKFGIELGLIFDDFIEAEKLISENNFDFVIGSSHKVRDEDLYFGSNYYKRNKITAYNYYFEQILENIKNFKNFDVYGHLDYVYRYSSYENNKLNYFDHKEIIDEVLKSLINNNIGLEVNLSGVRYNLNDFHPTLDILKSYKNFGGEIITIGSDTHDKQDVKSLILQAQDMVKEAGFTHLTTFDKRKPSFIKL